jgi:hypothetical protein
MASIFRRLVKEAVAQHVDPWADKGIEKLPAEKVTRYTYIPATGTVHYVCLVSHIIVVFYCHYHLT